MTTTRVDVERVLEEAGFNCQSDNVYTNGTLKLSCTNDRVHVFRRLGGIWQETWSLSYEDIKFDRFRRFVRHAAGC